MFNRANAMGKRRVAPSQYPRILFHGLRSVQLLSSIIVSGIMCYFMYYLHLEHISIPWTFIILLAISIGTMASLFLTIILYNLTHLSPKFNLILNGSISIVWALGFGLLSWSLSSTLTKACDVKQWGSEVGVMICKDYKTLWAFTLFGMVSSLFALFLDIHTKNKTTKRGAYVLPEDDKLLRMEDRAGSSVRAQRYEVAAEEVMMIREADMETGYHSGYGRKENEEAMDIGTHNRFRD